MYSKYETISPYIKYISLFKYKWYIYDQMEYLYESNRYDRNKLDLLMSNIINLKSYCNIEIK